MTWPLSSVARALQHPGPGRTASSPPAIGSPAHTWGGVTTGPRLTPVAPLNDRSTRQDRRHGLPNGLLPSAALSEQEQQLRAPVPRELTGDLVVLDPARQVGLWQRGA